ncbi:MAG: hypothetical protein DRQ41_00110 [Gammaproteobacteria bacterium]|nr:MAG: hypothetical protein DRQ41_00110 [Gammaproteobacteria bacterium]
MNKILIILSLSLILMISVVGNVFASIAKPKKIDTQTTSKDKKSLNGLCFDPMKGYTCPLPVPKSKKEDNGEELDESIF